MGCQPAFSFVFYCVWVVCIYWHTAMAIRRTALILRNPLVTGHLLTCCCESICQSVLGYWVLSLHEGSSHRSQQLLRFPLDPESRTTVSYLFILLLLGGDLSDSVAHGNMIHFVPNAMFTVWLQLFAVLCTHNRYMRLWLIELITLFGFVGMRGCGCLSFPLQSFSTALRSEVIIRECDWEPRPEHILQCHGEPRHQQHQQPAGDHHGGWEQRQ